MQRALLDNMVQGGDEYRTYCLPADGKNIQHAALSQKKQPEVVVLGLSPSEEYNITIIGAIKQYFPQTPLLIIAEHTQNMLVTTLLRKGATHFLTKPFSSSQLLKAIEHTRIASKQLSIHGIPIASGTQNTKSKKQAPLINAHATMPLPIRLYGKPLLIEGEAGTGKTMYVQNLKHYNNELFSQLVTVNASLAPDILVKHLQGAKNGILHIKTKGNLSERSNLFWQQQMQRLAAQPLQIIISHVTMPFAPTRNALIDYCHSQNIQTVAMKPLRERNEDIPHLANYYLQQYARTEEYGAQTLTSAALTKLKNYSWPGNMHQLQTVIFLTATHHTGPIIDAQDLVFHEPSLMDSHHLSSDTHVQNTMPFITPIDEHGDLRPLQEIEDEILTYALSCRGYSRSYIARKLGIGRTTLYRKAQHLESENLDASH